MARFVKMLVRSVCALLLLLPAVHALAMPPDEEIYGQITAVLDTQAAADIMNSYVLTFQGHGTVTQSSEYKWKDFVEAYKGVTGGPENNFGGRQFLHAGSFKTGIVNIALFLAQSLHESIRYDACDENNYSNVMGYPLSAACGQLGQDYTQYKCQRTEGPNNRNVECPVDPEMTLQARTYATTWGGAPPPLFCAPRSATSGGTGRWDFSTTCFGKPIPTVPVPPFPDPYLDEALVDGYDNSLCNAYLGHSRGRFTFEGCDADTGCPNTDNVATAGGTIRTDVEGCCWWGRGVIQTTGPCNTGRLNYYLTGTYYDENGAPQRESDGSFAYPDLNLCEDPGLICSGPSELKWTSGLFYWLFDIQSYSDLTNYEFDFVNELQSNGDAIFDDPDTGRALVDSVSGLVNRGCPAAACPGSGNVDGLESRWENFIVVMDALRHIVNPEAYPVPPGTPADPKIGEWYSKEVLCEPCKTMPNADCGLTWDQSNPPVCVGWATTPEACTSTGGVATAWCAADATTDPPTMEPIPTPTDAPFPAPTDAPFPAPTDAPFPAPTDAPVALPTMAPTETLAVLPLEDFGSTPGRDRFPLQRCQGDCDDDTDCDIGLVCWQRGRLQPVPGCFGDLGARTDFCIIDPKAAPTAPTSMPVPGRSLVPTMSPTADGSSVHVRLPMKDYGGTPEADRFPLKRCEGDCDDDEDCEGDLVCFQRGSGDNVPGCWGDLTARTDFCVIDGMADSDYADTDADDGRRLKTDGVAADVSRNLRH